MKKQEITIPLAEVHPDGVSDNIRWQAEITPLRHPHLWLTFVCGGNKEKFHATEEIRFSLAGHQASAIASALLAIAHTVTQHIREVAPRESFTFWGAPSDTALLDSGHRHGKFQMPLVDRCQLIPGLSVSTMWNGIVELNLDVSKADPERESLRRVEFCMTIAEARLLAAALLSAIGEVRYDVGA